MKSFLCSLLFAWANFNELGKEYNIVLETKQIHVKDCPEAFNPSMIEFQDGYLLVFRYMPNRSLHWISYLGIVRLDQNFNPIGETQFLNTRVRNTKVPSQSEDPRLFSCKGRLFVTYNDNAEVTAPAYGERRDIYLAELYYDDDSFFLAPSVKLYYEEFYQVQFCQKNWIPFVWNDSLLLSYTIHPHEVIQANLNTGNCYRLYETLGSINWGFGILRGSTPALLIDGQYLAFFHSGAYTSSLASWGWNMWYYFMGAYTFSAEPPFELTQISPVPISGEGFYTTSGYEKRVIFPSGFVAKDNRIYVSYGRDDREMWVATLDKEALMNSLIPVGHGR